MAKYVAFLRGINVGGKTVKMDKLARALRELNFENIKTLLASGNVVFEAGKIKDDVLTKKIETKLADTFGFEIHTIVRSIDEIVELEKSAPFKGINVTPETRLYVTFLGTKHASKLKIPYSSDDGNFKILRVSESEVISVLTVTPKTRSVDLMAILEKEFGKHITTRNWNTVLKVLRV